MQVYDKEVLIPPLPQGESLLEHFKHSLQEHFKSDEYPIRFVVVHTNEAGYHCELATLAGDFDNIPASARSSFEFRKRTHENTEQFNAVLLIPTGIDCSIGGHAGDATPVARLLASVCDHLIVHPNVVNASDINEIADNCLYVEGSVICRLLMGTVGLQKVRANRVLLLVEEHESLGITEASINSASAVRATLGSSCVGVVRMKDCYEMYAELSASGRASGGIKHLDILFDLLNKYRTEYDAVAITSVIQLPDVPDKLVSDYFLTEMINPWGGVEAVLTHAISTLYDVPSAHSPMMEHAGILTLDFGIVDPRKAAEVISKTFLHCILKGLHRSPRIITEPDVCKGKGIISAEDISCLIIPEGCLGIPTIAALEQEIPVIAVRENKNLMRNQLEKLPFRSDKYFVVDNYMEAVGLMQAMKAGVEPSSVRRPLAQTKITTYQWSDS